MVSISIDDFAQDRPWPNSIKGFEASDWQIKDLIDGVVLGSLPVRSDERGELSELLTTRNGPMEPMVHIYQVTAAPRSVRAWVLHKWQTDRLAFTSGDFRVVLFDLRPDSRTKGQLNIIDAGSAKRCLLKIPPLVVHGVENRGDSEASFINMPTRVYDPGNPDKWRLPLDHPGIPYRF